MAGDSFGALEKVATSSPGRTSSLESLSNVTPADVYFGRQVAVLTERSKIKRRTMERREKEYLVQKAALAETQNCLSAKSGPCPKYLDDLQGTILKVDGGAAYSNG
jgi:hypothetical protein